MSKILGIDLGTTNSAAAVMVGGKPTIVPSAEGATAYGKAFPSVVAFTQDEQLLVGEPARRQAVTNPERTIIAAKRKMGTDHKFVVGPKQYSPQQISAFILQKIKRDSEAFLGEKVEKAVITVPAYFNDNQRQATKDAGKIAGLEVVRLVNEPTAAALAYGLDKTEKEQKIMVFDFGGGTLDVTIMDFGEGVFEVLSTSGDTQLGGTDMDSVLISYVVSEFRKSSGIDISGDKQAMERVREAAEKAKIELSGTMTTQINLPFIAGDAQGAKHLSLEMTRAKLEDLVKPVVERCRQPMLQALQDAELTKDGIEKVILVGGPTRMPIVQKLVEGIVGPKIARGVDPMECVAMGAAVQGAVLTGEVKDVLLLDVTPLSLGIETLGGVSTKLIERNTTIPTKKSRVFSTASDNQSSVEIHVLQGERAMVADNVSLGRFTLGGIPPAPRGIPQVEVTFDIDANGILNVSAKDLATGNRQQITITSSTKLSEKDIQRMTDQADQFADEDKRRRELVETRNQAEGLVYAAQRMLTDMAEKVTEAERTDINGKTDALRGMMDGEDVPALKRGIEALNGAMHAITMRMYREGGQQYAKQQSEQRAADEAARAAYEQAGKGGAGGQQDQQKGGPGSGDTVDVEYEDVDE